MRATRVGLTALTLAFLTPLAFAADTYELDPVHSAVIFRIKHLGVSYTYGRFNDISGTFTVDDEKPETMSVQVTIKADSIDTGNKKRDDHLRGPDFFNVKQFPSITFKSKSVKRTGTHNFEITGDLSLHGKTKEITVQATRIGAGKDPWGGHRTGAELTFTIKRSDFGMAYMPDAIGDEVRLIVSIEGIQKKE